MGIRKLGSDAANRGLHRRDGRSEGGEGEFSVFNGRELVEEVGMAGKDFGTELGFEEANCMVEVFGGGGRGARGEGGGGEGSGREGGREEWGEEWVFGERV
jgi:hypothetical protein